ncbi:MAG: hypothetical protein IT385_23280 [Deltaproteobacteria bacterium]|nr:hypothetical protein [Deltaproteobacteria bacterium]
MSGPASIARVSRAALVVMSLTFVGVACADGADPTRATADVGDETASALVPSSAIGPLHDLEGARMPQDELAIAATADGWVVVLLANRRALSARTSGLEQELAPSADDERVVLLPVRHDGALAAPLEVIATPAMLGYGSVTRCGGRVWGTATTTDNRESWVFRVEDDLSALRVAHVVATGTSRSESSAPRVEVRSVDCVGGAAMFILFGDGPSRITLPSGDTIDGATSEGEAWHLVDADALIDEGRLVATSRPGDFLDGLQPGAGGTVLFTAFEVAGVSPSAVRVLRHDFGTGTTTPLVSPDLPASLFAIRYAEALDGPDAGRLAVLCARSQEEVTLEGVRVSDPLAGDFCVTFRDGHVLAHRAFRGIVPHDVRIGDGLVWFSGTLAESDPALGDAADGHAAFVVALDPTTIEPRLTRLVSAPELDTGPRALVAASAGCPAPGMMLETEGRARPDAASRTVVVRDVVVGADGVECEAEVVTAHGVHAFLSPLLLGPRAPEGCAARRLALLAPGTTLDLDSGSTPAPVGAFGVQVISPAGCVVVDR